MSLFELLISLKVYQKMIRERAAKRKEQHTASNGIKRQEPQSPSAKKLVLERKPKMPTPTKARPGHTFFQRLREQKESKKKVDVKAMKPVVRYKFNEGFTNAVRRQVFVRDLL